jgi:low affinity Fe/Cu permease
MKRTRLDGVNHLMERVAHYTTTFTGSSWAFFVAFGLTLTWLVSGPFFRYSDTWQLVMNTVSSIVTFLMVFLLQRSQNKDALAMQVKLNEIVAAVKGASNRVINVEDLSEQEVRALHERYSELAKAACASGREGASVSVDETNGRNTLRPIRHH